MPPRHSAAITPSKICRISHKPSVRLENVTNRARRGTKRARGGTNQAKVERISGESLSPVPASGPPSNKKQERFHVHSNHHFLQHRQQVSPRGRQREASSRSRSSNAPPPMPCSERRAGEPEPCHHARRWLGNWRDIQGKALIFGNKVTYPPDTKSGTPRSA